MTGTATGGEDLFALLCSNSKLERDRAEVELGRAVAEREVVVVQAVSDAATALLEGETRSSAVERSQILIVFLFQSQTSAGSRSSAT